MSDALRPIPAIREYPRSIAELKTSLSTASTSGALLCPPAMSGTLAPHRLSDRRGSLSGAASTGGDRAKACEKSLPWETSHVLMRSLPVNPLDTTMIYTHVLNRGGRGVQSPLDRRRRK